MRAMIVSVSKNDYEAAKFPIFFVNKIVPGS